MQIPIIDFNPFLTGDKVAKEAVASQISLALHEVGCFYLKNSGISQNLISQLFSQSESFFKLPEAEKEQASFFPDRNLRGYHNFKKSDDQHSGNEAMTEGFHFGKEIYPDEVGDIEDPFFEPNKWPKNPLQFREVMLELFNSCHERTLKVFQALAISLNIPEDYFTNFYSHQNHGIVLHHYPSIYQPPEKGKVYLAEHTDIGTLTFLFQDSEGLEIHTNAGEWVVAPFIPGAIIVLIGDLLQRWTNDKFRATPHRVIVPTKSHSAKQRYSCAFFTSPNHDASINTIPTCLDKDEVPKYPPILAQEYFKQPKG
ncbi:isopenicillin N synthase family oxygenase [Nostocaceae cyanobacterium CENA369]|uniref:Isopenicillin N synthase family oxygenase n=1 Tax=Dendronalium phyllosphericum CENA369 TaxID=1725256 RepID=A0A8J7ILP3_9NOST|nr:2-oxoglutarate and iron-dependent oxygenase domain-containing protein [Dendronalium phyllosphericum]MBH8578105.1 isopenicillin N synthase family oxygenase [Dendronalium phyllosphericum CENA369]